MPKRVDHGERRRRIAEALWRIASARGLDGASLRDVAAEAGISLGQLQHYFSSKDEMLLFALEHINEMATERIRDRITTLSDEPPAPRLILREIAAEMLPLNDESRTGMLVQIAYFIRAVHDQQLQRHAREGVPALREFYAGLLRSAVERGEVARDRDPETEAALFMALVDGLGSYALLGVHTPEEAMGLVDAHLGRLFGG